jgi:nucleotide-binding universal stress UspA family protein
MFKLVVAVDGSEFSDRAIQSAARLTKAGSQVEAVLVNVRDDPRAYGIDDRESIERIEKDQRRRQDEVLLAADKLARSSGLKAIVRAAMGFPAFEIVRIAGETGADAIAMGVHGFGPPGGPFIGPVTHRVLHQASMPVLLSK